MDFFSSNNGLCQGDPLSPYLFAMVMKYFSVQMEELYEKGVIKNIFGINDDINHMVYADNLIIFMKDDITSAKALSQVLKKLDKYAGLKLNTSKSKKISSKDCRHKEEICSILQIKEGTYQTKYFGLPLSTNFIKNRECTNLLNKVSKKIDG